MAYPPQPQNGGLTQDQKQIRRYAKIITYLIILIVIIAIAVYAAFTLTKRGDVEFVNFQWSDNHPFFSSAYVHATGTLYNAGSATAQDVQLTTRIYNSQGALLETDTMNIGNIASKEYKNVITDIQYSGTASRVQYEIRYLR